MQPLAYRMRPKNLDEVVGQEHLVGNKKIIRRMVEAKLLSSMILYGPPGIGKTSIAVAEEGKMSGTVILLLDEIHRLDKTKQDFLLPLLESGNIILIGATTENPYISISPAIRSRCQIFELHRLKKGDISHAIDRALKDSETGLGKYNVELTKDARNLLIEKGNGDLRATLNALELAVLSTKEEKQENADNKLVIDKVEMQDSIQFKSQNYDANGDGHYDLLSAFQKSIRGSDTDAALYYLGNLCESGDLVAICRRLLVIAYEDIGLANPPACSRAVNAVQAAQMVGLPEARIILSNAVIELCLSPKSNSAITAIDAAIGDIRNKQNDPIPDSLKDAHYKGAATLNHGVSYLYPHDFQGDWIAQQYLPNNLKNVSYFNPKGNSKIEDALKRQYLRLKKMQKDGLEK